MSVLPQQPVSPRSPNINEPLIVKVGPSDRKEKFIPSLLENFIIPSPSTKKQHAVLISVISTLVFFVSIAAIFVVIFARHARFGGIKLYAYLFTIDGVVLGFVLVMWVVTGIMRMGAKLSHRFRYYALPFTFPIYTCLWAILCFVVLPIIVPDIQNDTDPAKILQDCIRIVASCSIVSGAGNMLFIVMERVVYGRLQIRLWNVLWSERCVAVAALENNAPIIHEMTERAQPENVLNSIAKMQRDGEYGLASWLGLEEVDFKDDHAVAVLGASIAHMIMRRDAAHRGYITLGDLIAIPNLRNKDAQRLYHVFDMSEQGYASPDDIRKAIVNIMKERKHVIDMITARSLIVDIVQQIILTIVILICAVIVLVVLLGVQIYTLLVGLGTTFIGLGFALSTTIQGLLAALQMIFFVRPFEIGDIVTIDDGQPLQVEKVTIVSTLFYSLQGYGVYYPNSELAKARISNWRRSKDVITDINLYLSMDTRAEHLALLKHKFQAHIDANPLFAPRFNLLVSDTQDQYITVVLRVTLKTTWQERPLWIKYVSDLRLFATTQTVDLGIHYQYSEICKNVEWDLSRHGI